MTSFQKISGLIGRELAQYSAKGQDIPADEQSQSDLRLSWRKHAGNAVMHTFPLLFESGKLIIYCESSVWASSIRHQTQSLTRKFIGDGLKVTDIKIKMRPKSSSSTRQQNSTSFSLPIAPTQRTAKQIALTAQTVSHPGLKRALLKLAERQSDS